MGKYIIHGDSLDDIWLIKRLTMTAPKF